MFASNRAVQFTSQSLDREADIEQQIKARGPDGHYLGGLVAEEIKDQQTGQVLETLLHIGNPYEDHPTIVTLPTRCTKEEIQALRDRILPIPEAYEMLSAMAVSYRLRSPLIVEGDTALGKSYLAIKFTELLYGPGIKPLDFYCSGQTDVSELMAKWVPRVENAKEMEKWKAFLGSPAGQDRLASVAAGVEEQAHLTDEQRVEQIKARLQGIAAEVGLSGKTQWDLQLGAIPRAMCARIDEDGNFSFPELGGDGFILKVDEVGLAKPNVINALLKLRGENGRVADSIQLWEHGGRMIQAGPGFWFIMTTNPPESGFLDRNEIDPALARGAIFLRMGKMSPESINLAAERYFTYAMGNRRPGEAQHGRIFDVSANSAAGRELGEIVGAFHREFASALAKGEKGGRQQKIPVTFDDMARLADYAQNAQVRSRDTGHIDLCETLRRGVKLIYLNRLADTDMKKLMSTSFEKLLTDATLGVKQFRGGAKTRKEIIDTLIKEAMAPKLEETAAKEKEDEQQRRAIKQARFEFERETERTIQTLRTHQTLLKENGQTAQATELDEVIRDLENELKAASGKDAAGKEQKATGSK